MEKRYAFLLMFWLFDTFFIYYSFHESLLTSILYENPSVVINSVEDMAKFAIEGKLKKFYVLDGEAGKAYIESRDHYIRAALNPLMDVITIDEKNQTEWDAINLPLFASGEYAIISDNCFLDYKYVTNLAQLPNLYRGQVDSMSLPYFIAFSSKVPPQIKNDIDKM